ncbi:MAG: hypothetical protein A2569_03410 [Candidatus Vogelbacteria bacterium RIFOXYD1_FULL_51_18]|uniref:Uncharacterized protein n=1 Tax=Candidatus Vogelbacteria bacterium RIFOXYD1_FULL_51_18 TaxID=1802440 RepID=A0A1G2QIR9_9BACT|nr:MAG: hypothetical protein A2569_03410 [Candidatus Vogelbacteria bacterium RIFOXYD1_FULL_51_18]
MTSDEPAVVILIYHALQSRRWISRQVMDVPMLSIFQQLTMYSIIWKFIISENTASMFMQERQTTM